MTFKLYLHLLCSSDIAQSDSDCDVILPTNLPPVSLCIEPNNSDTRPDEETREFTLKPYGSTLGFSAIYAQINGIPRGYARVGGAQWSLEFIDAFLELPRLPWE